MREPVRGLWQYATSEVCIVDLPDDQGSGLAVSPCVPLGLLAVRTSFSGGANRILAYRRKAATAPTRSSTYHVVQYLQKQHPDVEVNSAVFVSVCERLMVDL